MFIKWAFNKQLLPRRASKILFCKGSYIHQREIASRKTRMTTSISSEAQIYNELDKLTK